MSDERWDDLGVSHRGFLKPLVGGAFVAPVVVSFRLDGIAQAGAQSFGNGMFQGLPDQAVPYMPTQASLDVLEHDPRCSL